MVFSPGLLTVLIYGALIWCALSALGLAAMLIKDLLRGESW